MPKNAGGWNIIDMKLWNKAAVTKLLRCLAKKKDRIWIRWIHAYYIKGLDLFTMKCPNQASWIVQKIIGSAQYFQDDAKRAKLVESSHFSIKKLYLDMRSPIAKVQWH